MALGAQTVHVKVELDAEAFQDAVQHAIDAAAHEALVTVTQTEHVRPEDVKVGDFLMVPVRVMTIQPPDVGGPQDRPHIRTLPVPGPWSVGRSGRIWTHGWTSPDAPDLKLERVVQG